LNDPFTEPFLETLRSAIKRDSTLRYETSHSLGRSAAPPTRRCREGS